MATRFNVADVPLENVLDQEAQKSNEGTTDNAPLAEESVQGSLPFERENANAEKNQITITSESNFALYEVNALTSCCDRRYSDASLMRTH